MNGQLKISEAKVLALLLGVLVVPCVHSQITTIWGGVTNGVRLGLETYLKDSWGMNQAPHCVVVLQNVSSNRVFLRLAPESQSNFRLLCPDGSEASLRPDSLFAMNRIRHPVTQNPGETDQLKSFSVTNLFDLRSSGLYTLVISDLATTNRARGGRPYYFIVPAVTNTFEFTLPKLE